MDKDAKCLLQSLLRKIPFHKLRGMLEKWDRLTAAQRRSVDFTQSKWSVMQTIIAACEENGLTVKHVTELEMIYVMDNPNHGTWNTFQLMDPDDDAHFVDFIQFKEQLKSHLTELIRNVSIKTKKDSDEAVWIRLAWGSGFSRPNHLKPTYVLHYLQTPYVFVSRMTAKAKAVLLQALVLSTRHRAIKSANLSGQKLTAIRALLMKQNQQQFSTKSSCPLSEEEESFSNLHIEKEQAEVSSSRHRMAVEAFGDGMLPELQSAVYNLETKFKDPTNKTMMEREGPFRCIVTFSSPNLMESLRHCASTGIASTPVTPLLSSIPRKARNYFVITDNSPAACSQTLHAPS